MTRLIFIAVAFALAVLLPTISAQAQSIRTFVSTAGSDSNPCSISQPCRHFQAAVNATSAGGEVDALDAGAYGSFTISQAITIEGQGWSYVAPPSGGNAITINAVNGKVTLRGLSLNGVGAANAIGILFNSGASLNVQNSVIENFSRYGILFQPSGSNKISVSNTQVSDNSYGIYIGPASTGSTKGVLDHVHTDNNTNDGITVITLTQSIDVTITESVSAQNGSDGLKVTSANSNALRTNVYVRNSSFVNNGSYGLDLTNAYAFAFLTRSMIWGNGIGYEAYYANLYSYGDNSVSFDDEPDPNSVAFR
jgi:hypothetical protein